MAERIYYQGYHVGSREDDYNEVPATIQSSFINLINDPIHRDDYSDLQGQINRLDAELRQEEDEAEKLRSQVDKLEAMIREAREALR